MSTPEKKPISSPVKADGPVEITDRNTLLTDFVCCLLIAIGVLLAMKQLFRFDDSFLFILVRTGVILAVMTEFAAISQLARRRWMVPLFLTVTVALILLALYALGVLSELIVYFEGLFTWWSDLFPRDSVYNTNQTITLVQWLIAVSICTTVYLLVRRIRSFLVILTLETVLFIVIGVNNFRNNLGALCFIGAGMFPLLVRSYHRNISARLDKVWVSNRRMMAASLIICCVLALIAGQLIPSDTSRWKNQHLSEFYKKLSSLENETTVKSFTLHSSGLQPNQDRLGGNISLDHTPVLFVSTQNPTLLKGKVYTDYTGKGWTADNESSYDLQDHANLVSYSQAFDLGRPQKQNGDNPLSDAMPNVTTTVTIPGSGYSLYTSGRVFSLSVTDTALKQTLLFNARSELFSDSALPQNYRYQFSARVLNRSTAGLESRIQAIEKSSASSGSGYIQDSHYNDIYDQYTQLPSGLPGEVKTLAQKVTAGKYSPYAKMEALETYLKTHYTYTLTPGSVPGNVDFVDYFLKTGKGYCVYFASAMTVMARTLGVPSRFVIGYGLEGGGSNWTAYGDTAHAWVECYIHGVGWTTFDPTASSSYSNPAAAIANPTNLPVTTTTKTTTSTTKAPAASTKPSATASTPAAVNSASFLLWAAVLLGAAFVLLLAMALLKAQKRRTAFTLETVRARCRTNAACADWYYTDILRQLELLGYSPHRGETIYQHGRRVAPLIRNNTQEAGTKDVLLEKAFSTVMEWRYGEIPPTDGELEELSGLHAALEQRLKDKLGAFRHFVIRYLFAK